ncbi:helix-turn-helix transcriptional regulator [Halomonas cupida]|uniref:helix-turn-helix domain-containing protein n=1 Tax=Halomonas cupida TaxID=44933 RepID=UPI0039B6189D
MTKLSKTQIINGADGEPAFVIIPFDEYMTNYQKSDLIPPEVFCMVVRDGLSLVRAWRQYLGLSQGEVAKRIGTTQSSYARNEAVKKPHKATRVKIAKALGITPEQLES